jgi:hypothetical protein
MNRTMSRLISTCLTVLLIMTTLLAGKPPTIYAQSEVQLEAQPPEYSFGEVADFRATLRSNSPVKEVLLLVQNGSEANVQVSPASLDLEGNVAARVNLREYLLRAFSNVDYWFQVTFENGETYTSPKQTFFYNDNRFTWKMVEGAPLRVHWYEGDIPFAQKVLNVAQNGLQRAQQILPQVLVPQAIDIYVYPSGDQMRDVLLTSNQNWVAGHADPDLNVVVVSLPPGPEQQLEMERQIPHELMHVIMFYTDGNAYTNLPAWFNEGLASLAELYPNPDYPVLLQNAYQTNSLIPLATLCKVFPSDSQQALLAYAESASFLNFLSEEYGSIGFERLMALYAQGQSCEQAIETGFRASLSRLESQWQRQTFAPNSIQTAAGDLLPWLIILVAILVGPIILVISMIRRRSARAEL